MLDGDEAVVLGKVVSVAPPALTSIVVGAAMCLGERGIRPPGPWTSTN
ncbi:hypothetical protein [Nocardia sp. CY41]|nr:hypothetical protein [Nocardia sp. CY41]